MSQSNVTTLPSFAVRPYQSDGGAPMSGLIILVGGLAVAGVIMGIIAHFVAQYFWLIVIFPLGIGLGLGVVANFLIGKGKIRNVMIAALAGLMGGIFSMCMMHVFDYLSFKKEVAALPVSDRLREFATHSNEELEKAYSEVDPQDRQGVKDLMRILRVKSFLQFMNYTAEDGVTIGRAGHSGDKGINLGFYGSWIYWIVEVGLVTFFVFITCKSRAGEPFSVKLDKWKTKKALGVVSVGAVPGVNNGDLNIIASSRAANCDCVLSVHVAEEAGFRDEVDVFVEQVTVDGKGNKSTKAIAKSTWPADSVQALKHYFNRLRLTLRHKLDDVVLD